MNRNEEEIFEIRSNISSSLLPFYFFFNQKFYPVTVALTVSLQGESPPSRRAQRSI